MQIKTERGWVTLTPLADQCFGLRPLNEGARPLLDEKGKRTSKPYVDQEKEERAYKLTRVKIHEITGQHKKGKCHLVGEQCPFEYRI